MRRNRGISLAEVIIANVLLLVMMLPLLSLFSSMLRSVGHQDRLLAAEECAQYALDQARTHTLKQLKVGPGSWENLEPFRRKLDVLTVDEYKDELVLLQATVTWKDGKTTRSLVRKVRFSGAPN